MQEYTIPLIIRGEIIEDDLVTFEARRGRVAFRTPDVTKYMDRLPLGSPTRIGDLYDISLDEIIEFLDQLGRRLSPDENPHVRKALDMAVHTSGLAPTMLHRMYSAMGPSLSATALEEIVEHNIGRDYLEGWKRRQLTDREVDVRAFGGRLVHLNAGNGPTVALFALINGSILRCDNIIKNPSNDPYTSVAIVQTMIDMAPDHPITRHFTVGYWKGGDEAVERQLYGTGKVDKIVAWGGEASMKSIRRYLGPGLDLVALDPKISASIVGHEALQDENLMNEAADRLARDVGFFNQEGCVAARVAYVVSGTSKEELEALNTFGAKVNAALQHLPEEVSTPHPEFDPVLKDEIEGLRYSEDFRVLGCRASEGGVIVSQVAEPVDFSDQLACRVVNLVPVPSAQAALEHVTVHTQTIGIYPPALKDELRDGCILHGAQRLTDLGCALFASMPYPHDGVEILRRMARWGVLERFSEAAIDSGGGLVMASEQSAATDPVPAE